MPRTLLLLFLGDTATDRRVQNFRKFFEASGWNVELLAVAPSANRGPLRFFEYHQRLGEAVRAKHVDVVLACDLYSLSAAAWLKRHKRARLLIYDAREVYTELPTVQRKPVVKCIWRTIERRGLAVTDIIVTTGPHDIQAIFDIHGFLPPPILIRNLPWRDPNLIRDRSLLDRFNIPSDAKVLVYIGGLQEGRGLEKLIKGSGKWIVDSGECHLLLIGGGILRSKLEHFVKDRGFEDRIHFADVVPSENAMKIAAACDVGVSLIEPISRSYELALPSKLFEYMMAGLPVISSKLQQVLDLFAEAKWITFVDSNDPLSIQEGIRQALINSEDESIHHVEREFALREFHFEQDAANLLTAIGKAL